MAKTEDKKAATTEKAPEPKAEVQKTEAPQTIMSDRQKEVYQFARQADKEPRRFDSVEDLAPDVLMAFPEEITKHYPERAYRWGNTSKVQKEISQKRGMWQIVTRSNHSHAPEVLFDDTTGAILYEGQNILLYTWRDNVVFQQNRILAEYDASVKAAKRDIRAADYTISQVDDTGDGRFATDLLPGQEYDFGPTNAEV